ncbi:MAG: FtsX-like permease family protein, partial [Chloroflexi bacterium]
TSINPAAQMRLTSIRGQQVKQVFAGIHDSSYGNGNTIGTNGIQTLLRAVKGYQLASGRAQDLPDVTVQKGNNLSAADAGTNNVLVAANLRLPPLNLHIGDTFVVQSVDTTVTKTLTIKGFYAINPLKDFPLIGLVLADDAVARAIGSSLTTDYLSLRVEQRELAALKVHISQAQPQIQVISFADSIAVVNQIITNVIVMLVTISSLTLIAGLIIMGNAVALAMLERRREMGILKSVGYTSRSLLATILVENGLIGTLGSTVAMVLVSGTMVALRLLLLKTDPGFSPGLALILIATTALLTMLIAATVAWNAARVRPLEVLRYE